MTELEASGLGDSGSDGLGESDGDGDSDGLGLGLGEGESDAEGVGDGEGDSEGVGEGVGDGDCVGVGDGAGGPPIVLPMLVPGSLAPQVRPTASSYSVIAMSATAKVRSVAIATACQLIRLQRLPLVDRCAGKTVDDPVCSSRRTLVSLISTTDPRSVRTSTEWPLSIVVVKKALAIVATMLPTAAPVMALENPMLPATHAVVTAARQVPSNFGQVRSPGSFGAAMCRAYPQTGCEAGW